MHRSSSMTFVYKYLLPFLLMGSFILGVILAWNSSDTFMYNWSRKMLLITGFISIWLVILIIRLRGVEASAEHLVIKSGKKRKIVKYEDIDWITQYVLINPVMIALKYYDKETGESKTILILPSISAQFFKFNSFREMEITVFIRTQMIAKQSGYLQSEEPSRWRAALLIFGTGLPLAIITERFFTGYF